MYRHSCRCRLAALGLYGVRQVSIACRWWIVDMLGCARCWHVYLGHRWGSRVLQRP